MCPYFSERYKNMIKEKVFNYLLLSFLFFLTGCFASHRHAVKQVHSDVNSDESKEYIKHKYYCGVIGEVTANYDNRNPNENKVRLFIGNKSYDLYQVVSASGAKYSTQSGRNHRELTWWIRGDKGFLYNPSDKVLARCDTLVNK